MKICDKMENVLDQACKTKTHKKSPAVAQHIIIHQPTTMVNLS